MSLKNQFSFPYIYVKDLLLTAFVVICHLRPVFSFPFFDFFRIIGNLDCSRCILLLHFYRICNTPRAQACGCVAVEAGVAVIHAHTLTISRRLKQQTIGLDFLK